MKSLKTVLFSVIAALTLVSAAMATELGDVAPPLSVAAWTKGKPVDLAALKGKQVAVVEFWATWCPPCIQSIPHLTELQKQYKDVVFIGVSNEDPDTVKKFVAKMGAKMDYTVAVDQTNQTSLAYPVAFGINTIPTAFIVDKSGRIVWVGSPLVGLSEALEQVVAGKYDVEKAKHAIVVRAQAEVKLQEFFKLAIADDNDPQLEKLGAELVALDKEAGGLEPGQTFDPAEVRKMIRFRKALVLYKKAVAGGTNAAETAQLEQKVTADAPKEFDLKKLKEIMTAESTFTDYYNAVSSGADKTTVAALADKVANLQTHDPTALNMMASIILIDEKIQTRDYALATKLARAAVDASDAKDPESLDTYAHALYGSGKTDDAITYEKKAIAVAADDTMRQELEKTLKSFQDKPAKK